MSFSVQRAFHGRALWKSAKGSPDVFLSKFGFPEPEVVLLRDGAPSPVDFSGVTISSISMVLLFGKFGVWSLKLRD